MKTALLCVSLLLAVAGGVAVYLQREQQLDSQFVVLRFDRPSALTGAICDADVFVNGVKIGSVANGRTKKFHVTPGPDGNNTIYAQLIARIGPDLRSNIVRFEASEGEVVYARYEINSWVMKPLADTRLQVAVQKRGKGPSALAHMTGPAPREGPNIPGVNWDAIGAIAGVLSLLVAITAFFQKSPL